MIFHSRMNMTIHILTQTIWFAVQLQLLTSLIHENVLPLNAAGFIHCEYSFFFFFFPHMDSPRGWIL